MFRLIEADLAATGKMHLRNGTPSCFLNFGAPNVLLCEGGHFGFQVFAHEVEFVGTTIFVGRVECGFCGRQGEDQPAVTRIDGLESENVAEEGAVCLGVFAVEDYVSARNHWIPPRNAQNFSGLGENSIKRRSRFVQLCLAYIQVSRIVTALDEMVFLLLSRPPLRNYLRKTVRAKRE